MIVTVIGSRFIWRGRFTDLICLTVLLMIEIRLLRWHSQLVRRYCWHLLDGFDGLFTDTVCCTGPQNVEKWLQRSGFADLFEVLPGSCRNSRIAVGGRCWHKGSLVKLSTFSNLNFGRRPTRLPYIFLRISWSSRSNIRLPLGRIKVIIRSY